MWLKTWHAFVKNYLPSKEYISEKKQIWLSNKEHINDHGCERTNMAPKCKIFIDYQSGLQVTLKEHLMWENKCGYQTRNKEPIPF